jgi:hypothetical protein
MHWIRFEQKTIMIYSMNLKMACQISWTSGPLKNGVSFSDPQQSKAQIKQEWSFN